METVQDNIDLSPPPDCPFVVGFDTKPWQRRALRGRRSVRIRSESEAKKLIRSHSVRVNRLSSQPGSSQDGGSKQEEIHSSQDEAGKSHWCERYI